MNTRHEASECTVSGDKADVHVGSTAALLAVQDSIPNSRHWRLFCLHQSQVSHNLSLWVLEAGASTKPPHERRLICSVWRQGQASHVS